jgi:hypothetical protein
MGLLGQRVTFYFVSHWTHLLVTSMICEDFHLARSCRSHRRPHWFGACTQREECARRSEGEVVRGTDTRSVNLRISDSRMRSSTYGQRENANSIAKTSEPVSRLSPGRPEQAEDGSSRCPSGYTGGGGVNTWSHFLAAPPSHPSASGACSPLSGSLPSPCRHLQHRLVERILTLPRWSETVANHNCGDGCGLGWSSGRRFG